MSLILLILVINLIHSNIQSNIQSNDCVVVEYHYSDNRSEIKNSCEEKSEIVIIRRNNSVERDWIIHY